MAIDLLSDPHRHQGFRIPARHQASDNHFLVIFTHMYNVDFDPETGIFHIKASGYWTMATLVSFSPVVLARGTATRLRYGQFAVLTDLREMAVVPQNVANGITGLLRQSEKITTAPFALVVSTMLHKIQMARIIEAPHTRVFLDWDEANDWLDECWSGRKTA